LNIADLTSFQAKWGEGDSRWRVENLGNLGTNVNNWHWVEKDALPWVKDRLNELLGDVELASDAAGNAARTTGVRSVEGEAIVNNRKNKVIAAYEFSIAIGWQCTGGPSGSDGVAGVLRCPYVSEENHDEDTEIQVAVESPTDQGSSEARLALDLVVAKGRAVVQEGVATLVKELMEGGPMRETKAAAGEEKLAPPAEKPVPVPAVAAAPSASGQSQAADGAAKPPSSKPAVAKAAKSRRSVELKETFFASSRDIYECLTDPRRMLAYTRSPAESDPRPGGVFSMFGGSIAGTFSKLEQDRLVEMQWRFNSWEEGIMSTVVARISEPERGRTVLELRHTGLPDSDKFGNHDVQGTVEAGWRQQVLLPIRQTFGYGV
jgi:activator of HSP90 ATPase